MEKTKPPYSVFSNVWFMVKAAWHSYKQIIVLCVLFALFELMAQVVQLYLSPTILAQVQEKASAGHLIKTILVFAGLLFVSNAGKVYTDDNALYGRIALRSQLIALVENKFATTSYPNVEDPKYYEDLMRLMPSFNSNAGALEGIWDVLGHILRDGLGLVLYVVLLSALPPLLIVIVLLTSAAAFLVNRRVNGWEYSHREELAKLDKKAAYLRNKSGDTALGKDIRIFGIQNWLQSIHTSVMAAYKAFQNRKQNCLYLGNLADILMTVLRNGIAYYYLIQKVLQGSLSVPEFLLYFTAFSGLTQWVSGLLGDLSTLHRQSLEITNLREFLSREECFRMEDGDPIVPEDKPYTLKLEHVSFRYPESEENTLTDIDLTIRGGEKAAIVGLNGAGKTTLVKLLCGFVNPTEGRVLLNGEDIRRFNRRQYYHLFTAVFQQFATINGTIEENVAMRTIGIDSERVTECLENAGLLEKVQALPDGMKTHLGREVYENGTEFSGGEMQRLILARALYRNAPILVLDEPTAALDPIAEDRIYQQYHAMTRGRTSVFISHRLASTRFCDRILMLQNGRIAEDGTHEALMKAKGPYAELFEVQSRYYKEDDHED